MRAAFLAAALASISSIDFAAAQQLANGKYFQAGNIGDATWRWQASGVLSVGRCPFSLGWSTCYISSLGATGNLQETTQADYLASLNGGLAAAAPTTAPNGIKYTTLAGKQASAEERALLDDEDLDAYFEAFPEQEPDRYSSALTTSSSTSFKAKRQVVGCGTGGGTTTPTTTTTTAPPSTTSVTPVTPRQRNEIFTWPGSTPATTWTYKWKTWQSRSTGTTYNFFHAWQILRRDGCGGAVITLDYVNGQVVIKDAVRGCSNCAVYKRSLAYWFGNTITHEMTVTWGINGAIDYKAYVGTNLRVPALTYSATGDMGSSASLKFGNYRSMKTAVTASQVYLGDWSQTRIA